jgi:hypothetical protein
LGPKRGDLTNETRSPVSYPSQDEKCPQIERF